MVLLLLGVIAGVIAVTQAQRKVAVQYAQRAVGRKIVSGGTSFMPLRVNYAGVMPIIFAQAILMFPQKILHFLGESYNLPFLTSVAGKLNEGAFLYMVLYAAMILFFSYFWVATQFNEIQIADDLKKKADLSKSLSLYKAKVLEGKTPPPAADSQGTSSYYPAPPPLQHRSPSRKDRQARW